MRMDQSDGAPRRWSSGRFCEALADAIFQFGEELAAHRAIVYARRGRPSRRRAARGDCARHPAARIDAHAHRSGDAHVSGAANLTNNELEGLIDFSRPRRGACGRAHGSSS
jgi:hypothetical protein